MYSSSYIFLLFLCSFSHNHLEKSLAIGHCPEIVLNPLYETGAHDPWWPSKEFLVYWLNLLSI